MADQTAARGPLRAVAHRRHHVAPPSHHVVQQSTSIAQTLRDSVPLLPTLMPTQQEHLYSTEQTSVFLNAGPDQGKQPRSDASTDPKGTDAAGADNGYVRLGFQNPWDSWHKPTIAEVWNGLRWWREGAPTVKIEEARQYEDAVEAAQKRESSRMDEASEDEKERDSVAVEEDKGDPESTKPLETGDLDLQTPDFAPSEHDEDMVRATWLGHASVLLQVPPLRSPKTKDDAHGQPVRILFDPIFSMRCSPSQYVGPVRLYPAPCQVDALPPVDVVCISHSHYDHLDYDSIVQLWRANRGHIRFVVPLGNKEWFVGLGLGIDEERVTELDWWDEVWLTDDGVDGIRAGTSNTLPSSPYRLRVICTPAQHGSGRYGFDAGRSLWSSWCVERTPVEASAAKHDTFRAFFGGDSGFQFHSSSPQATEYATCPAFEEVNRVIGVPDLSFLPISVGATLNFVKSYDTLGLVPELDSGLTGANHMTSFDAVRVARILAGYEDRSAINDSGKRKSATGDDKDDDGKPDTDSETKDAIESRPTEERSSTKQRAVAMAIHWGTFVSGMDEIRRNMRELEGACTAQNVKYVRSMDERRPGEQRGRESETDLTMACVDHGDTVWLKIKES